MNWLNIHPRLLSFWILILTLNLAISIKFQYHVGEAFTFYWLTNLTFPVWGAVLTGFPIGLIIAIIPQDEYILIRKLIRSQVFGIMIATFIFFIFYLYQALTLFYPS